MQRSIYSCKHTIHAESNYMNMLGLSISYVLVLQSCEVGAKRTHKGLSCLVQSRDKLTLTLNSMWM